MLLTDSPLARLAVSLHLTVASELQTIVDELKLAVSISKLLEPQCAISDVEHTVNSDFLFLHLTVWQCLLDIVPVLALLLHEKLLGQLEVVFAQKLRL